MIYSTFWSSVILNETLFYFIYINQLLMNSQHRSRIPSEFTFQQIKKKCTSLYDVEDTMPYGSGLLLRIDQYEADLILIQKVINTDEAYQKLLNLVKTKKNKLKCPYLLQIISFTCIAAQQSNLCGSVYKLSILNEYNSQSLQQKIQNYKKQNQKFTEHDLLNLIDQVLGALIVLSKNDMRHGFIQPQNIFCSNDGYQITDIRFLTDMYEYEYQMLGFTNTCYLSPSLFEQLGKRTLNPIYNYEKSEIFSLGLSVLEAALLSTVYTIYDYQRQAIKTPVLESHIEKVNQGDYSPKFVSLLKGMLQIDEKSRWTALGIAKELQDQLQQQSYSYYLLHKNGPMPIAKQIEPSPPPKKNEVTIEKKPILPTVPVTVTTTPITPVKPSYDRDHLQATKDTDYRIYTHTQSFISPLDDKLNRFHHDLVNVQSQFHAIHNQYEDKRREYRNSESQRIRPQISELEQTYESPATHRHQYTFQESQKPSQRYNKPVSVIEKVFVDDIKLTPTRNDFNFKDLEQKLTRHSYQQFPQQYSGPTFFESPLDKTLEQQERQGHVSEMVICRPQAPITARLPQSDLIHLHSDASLYLNDLFLDSRKETKYF